MWELIGTVALWLFFMLVFLFLPVVLHILGMLLRCIQAAMDAWSQMNQRIIDWMEK